jgi:hypothetical protein
MLSLSTAIFEAIFSVFFYIPMKYVTCAIKRGHHKCACLERGELVEG